MGTTETISNGAPQLLTGEQVCERLQIGRTTLRSLVQKGKLPFVKLAPNTIRWSEQSLADYLASLQPPPTSRPLFVPGNQVQPGQEIRY
jgi:excisionase family DNA binding protein